MEDYDMQDEERNINFNEAEIVDLKRALNCLIEQEQDARDYTGLFDKLNSYYN